MNHLCIGCGVCATACPANRISMPFSKRLGAFQPDETLTTCDRACGICEKVCPFVPENSSTPDLTHELFGSTESINHDDVLGYYLSTYVGYSVDHRPTSASGGLATWLLETLINTGEIDHVICVGPAEQSPTLFSYRVCGSVEEIRACSSSCYQPVEISQALRHVLDHEGRYAITALPCMAKALRLAMRVNPRLKSRIHYILGLTCGQMKSRHFVDYISTHFVKRKNPTSVQFRIKRSDHPASDYAYRFLYQEPDDKTHSYEVGWSDGIDHVFCDRWFTLEACDYCDDVFAECADAVFMDAWLPDYEKDWQGHTLVVTRNAKIAALLNQGMVDGTVKCEDISHERVIDSQRGVVFQKRILAGCHYEAASNRLQIPVLRHDTLTTEHRKKAFVLRNIRHCLRDGASTKALTKISWLTSSWGWRWAKLYSSIPWLSQRRTNRTL